MSENKNTVVAAKTGLVTIDPVTYVAQVYETFVTRLDAAIEASKEVKYVITTKEGMEVAKANRALFRDIRISCNKKREESKAPILEAGKLIDSRYKEIEAKLAPYETKFDADITAEQKRLDDIKAAKIKEEAERQAALQSKIDDIKNAPLTALNMDSAGTIALRDLMADVVPNAEEFGERFVEAEIALTASIAQLSQMIEGKLAQEQLAARLESERIEAERLAVIAAQERAAEEQKAREKQAAEAEQIKAERAELDRQRAELAAQQKAIDDQRAKAEREAAAKLAEQEAAIRAEERAKAEAEQRTAAEAQAKIDAAAKDDAGKLIDAITEDDDANAAVATPNLDRQPGMPAFPDVDNRASIDRLAGGGKVIRKPSRPAHAELIQFVANNFNVSYDQACTWVIETAESLKVAA